MTIDNTTTFASLGLNDAQLTSLLQSCNVDSAEITKILGDPSVYKVGDVVKDFNSTDFKLKLDAAKGGDASTVTVKQLSKFEWLVMGLLEMAAKNNELALQQNNNQLKGNQTALETSIKANAKIATAARINAVASALGGAIGIGAGVKSIRVLNAGAPPASGVSATSQSFGAAERSGAYNAIGNSSSGLVTGLASLWTAGIDQEGRNLQANAEFIKSNTDSMRSAAAAIEKVNENLANIISQAGSVVQTASRA
jgi:hypothetical protein